jgi:O-Antigen ligase
MTGVSVQEKIGRWWPAAGWLLIVVAQLPGSLLPYFDGKWLAVHLLAAAVALSFFLSDFRWPQLGKRAALALAALFCVMIAVLFRDNGWEAAPAFLDRASFFLLALAVWRGLSSGRLSLSDFWWPVAVSLFCVSLFGLVQVQRAGITKEMPYTLVGSTFGYANNTAQFVAIALLFFWGLERPRARIALPFAYALSAFSLAYLFLLRGRSALVGFLLGALFLLALRSRNGRSLARAFRARKLAVSLLLLAVLALVTGLQHFSGRKWGDILSGRIFAEKENLTSWRMDGWRQTTEMIADHPLLGVGVGRFTWEFVPYHAVAAGKSLSEDHVATAPHNEFLRYAAEEGVPLALAYLVGWLLFLRAWWRRRGSEELVVVPGIVCLLSEAVAQFPWENPFAVFFSAVLVGAMAARIWREGEAGRSRRQLWPIAGLGLAFCACFIWCDSLKVVAASKDYSRVAFACRWMPGGSESCLRAAKAELNRGDLRQAHLRLTSVLEREPANYSALRLMAWVLHHQGDNIGACYFLWRYDDLFSDQSTLHETLAKSCPPRWLSYFHRRRPMHYYEGGNAITVKR